MALKRIAERREKDRKLDAEAAVRESNRLDRWRRVFGSEDGMLVLDEILDMCGVMDSIHDTSARIHYNSGRQDLGHDIVLTILKADDSIYHRLVDKWVEDAAIREAKSIKGE